MFTDARVGGLVPLSPYASPLLMRRAYGRPLVEPAAAGVGAA